jgi:hypothetical protein
VAFFLSLQLSAGNWFEDLVSPYKTRFLGIVNCYGICVVIEAYQKTSSLACSILGALRYFHKI